MAMTASSSSSLQLQEYIQYTCTKHEVGIIVALEITWRKRMLNQDGLHELHLGGITLKQFHFFDAHALYYLVQTNTEDMQRWGLYAAKDYASPHATALRIVKENTSTKLCFGIWYLNALCGMIYLHPRDGLSPTYEVGYWLSHDYCGKGIMSWSCKRLCEYAERELGTHYLVARTDPKNIASQKVLLHSGFTLDRITKSWLYWERIASR